MGRTALYRDPVPYRPARAQVHLDADALQLAMPDGRVRWHRLDGVVATTSDGFVQEPWALPERLARGSSELIPHRHAVPAAPRLRRRFVRMLVIERERDHFVIITPPDEGAVAPGVVHMPEAPADAAIVEPHTWEALSEWLLAGGRLAACSISDLARLASIATPQFAVLLGEVAAQRALEYIWAESGPLRGGFDLDSALQPLVEAAKTSPRAGEALVSALSHAAGARRRRRWAR
ncbi:MAG TPA: hypothetical protein VMZ53_30840 [Kofleriaceae bacterium]|nr:hypothetical protein [Kofleriaceae bacterium]